MYLAILHDQGAFRQSTDSSGLCRIELVWSRHRFEVLCRGAIAPLGSRSWFRLTN